MRRTALAASLLILPVSALAQDPAKRPTGFMLLDALPAQTDIVVDVPDLPFLFESATKAGLGDAASWRAAFDAQLRAWGDETLEPGTLVHGGDALLAAADGEALLASMDIKLPGGAMPSARATLFAMRTTRDEKSLRAAFQDVVSGGLRVRYEGEPRTEEIAGRRVTALPGNQGALWVVLQDGLFVASDHPLAMGLFLRGLAKDVKSSTPHDLPAEQLKLVVRRGRGDAEWEGWIWGDGESVVWKEDAVRTASFGGGRSSTGVVILPRRDTDDSPLLPKPVSSLVDGSAKGSPPPTFVAIDADAPKAGYGDGPKIAGGAWRLGWLGAFAAGSIPPTFPGVDARLLQDVHAAAAKAAGAKAGEFIEWKSGEPGRLFGPLGHGPCTFLALRSLHDIARKLAPGGEAVASAKTEEKPRPDAPLPPPAEPKNEKDH